MKFSQRGKVLSSYLKFLISSSQKTCFFCGFTGAVAVCGGLGDGAGQGTPADLGRALVELLFLVRELDLLRDREGAEGGRRLTSCTDWEHFNNHRLSLCCQAHINKVPTLFPQSYLEFCVFTRIHFMIIPPSSPQKYRFKAVESVATTYLWNNCSEAL